MAAPVAAAAFFHSVAGGARYGGSDLDDLMLPLLQLLADALRHGEVGPLLWNSSVHGGYPVLAEGQMGAFYPVNWLLRWIPPRDFVTLSLLLSHVLAFTGMAWLARVLGASAVAAVLAGTIYSFGGFTVAHVAHLNVVAAVPWLPVVLGLVELGFRRRRPALWALAGLAWTLQWLCGHPQVPMMTGAMAVAWAAHCAWRHERVPARRLARGGLAVGTVLVVGLAGAAVYLLPLLELAPSTIRAHGIPDTDEAATWRVPAAALGTALAPFALGGPGTSADGPLFEERTFYAGVATLLLALAALPSRRRAAVPFFAAAAGLSLLLALGPLTHLPVLVQALPGFGKLRVPARFVFLLDASLALLAAFGLDRLAVAAPAARRAARALGLVALGLAAVVDWSAVAPGRQAVIVAGLLLATGAWLGLAPRPGPRAWRLAGLALVAGDLRWFAGEVHGAYRSPLYAAAPVDPAVQYVTAQPGWNRLVRQRMLQVTNRSLLHGAHELSGYAAIPLERQERYLNALHRARARQGVLMEAAATRFMVAPADWSPPGPSDKGGVRFWEDEVFASLGRGAAPRAEYAVDGVAVREVCIVGALHGFARLTAPVAFASLRVVDDAGRAEDYPLETADAGRGAAPPAFRTRDALWPPEVVADVDARGEWRRVYLLRVPMAARRPLQRVVLEYAAASGAFHLYGLGLVDQGGAAVSFSPRTEPTLRPVHAAGDLTVFETAPVRPRAFAVHAVRRVATRDRALVAVQAPGWSPAESVVLEDATAPRLTGGGPSTVVIESDEGARVHLRASMRGDGYLVLADAFYPGWRAWVDGQAVPIYAANAAFRAVYLPSGAHRVTFALSTARYRAGAAISLLAAVGVCGALAGTRRPRSRG